MLEPTVFAAGRRRRPDRTRHLAARPQGLEGKPDRDADRAAGAHAAELCRRAPTGRGSSRTADEYTRVTFPAEFLAGQEALVYTAGSAFRPDVQGPGYWVFAPARLAGGSIVVVNRGFVPLERKDAAQPRARRRARSISSASCAGRRRAGCSRRTTSRRTMSGIVRDPQAIAAAKKWDGAAPFYIEQEARCRPAVCPSRASSRSRCPTTTCNTPSPGSASPLGLAGVYGVWLTGRLRRST